MDDILIVGGGVVGLSLAYELSGHGLKVRVIDRDRTGQAASWAGAGIVPAAVERNDQPPLAQLAGLSYRLHPIWAESLREKTGIDTGFTRCGGLYLATQSGEVSALESSALADQFENTRQAGVAVEKVDVETLANLEPVLAHSGASQRATIRAAYFSPGESQIRNPRHLRALAAACTAQGVQINEGQSVDDFDVRGGRIRSVITLQDRYSAEAVCIATGCWSQAVATRCGAPITVKPVRGQIVLLECAGRRMQRIINVGPRYLVPRRDGRLLIGSTQDDVGFDTCTTAEGVSGLLKFALELAPALSQARVVRSWAGLRPATQDGLPYLGRVPGLDNAYLATGHFRSGLQMSPGTAVVMSQLIRGQRPEIYLSPFRLGRGE